MRTLSSRIASGQVPHALLFTGPRGADLGRAVQEFARELVGAYPHPDVREYAPEGKMGLHPLSAMHRLRQEVGLVPYQAQWQLFVVHEAERMLPTSSHALLKTLEEPPSRTVLALLSHYPESLLSTVRSRCQTITCPSVPAHIKHPGILAVLAGEASLASLQEEDEGLLETILLWYRDRALLSLPGSEAYLSYPEHRESIARTPPLSLERVTERLAQVRLGRERSIALSTCLEFLIESLSYEATQRALPTKR